MANTYEYLIIHIIQDREYNNQCGCRSQNVFQVDILESPTKEIETYTQQKEFLNQSGPMTNYSNSL